MAKEDPTRLKEEQTRLASQADLTRRTSSHDGDPTELLTKPVDLKTDGSQNSVFARLDEKIAEDYKDKEVLKSRFVLEKRLGFGGMGSVFLARDLLREEMEDSNVHIAIKVLNEDVRTLPGALQSLQREAKKAQTLSHPNIVTVYDFDRDGETAFITMEYIRGKELKSLLRRGNKLPVKQAVHILERVARGLAYAHQEGFVHADIKPANIFIGNDNTVKILDFGIAKAFTDASKEARSLADELTEGAMTPSYASTEMLRGEPLKPADDVYALAIMAYEMLGGRHPFLDDKGKPMPANIAQQVGQKLVPIPGIPRRLMKAIRQGLAFERKQRFQDAGQFLDAFKARNWKKDLTLAASAMVVTGCVIFAVNQGLEQVVPSINSIKPELASVAETLVEGDVLLAENDVGMAHRLYAQAWELANDLTVEDIEEREKVQSILVDRMDKVSNALIRMSKESNLDEYRLREIAVALEFLLQDDIVDNDKKIKNALEKIQQRIQANRQG